MCSNSEETNVEGVFIISLNEISPEHLIQKIINAEILPSPCVEKDCIKGYEWMVDTKYYTATVNLYSVQEKTDFDCEFCDTIRAIVFHINGKEISSFEEVLSWMPFLKNIIADVRLLVCDSCEYDETYKNTVSKWCVEHDFELVELNPSEETDDEDEGPFSKSKGYGRVTEALQSVIWTNLVMKRDREQNLSAKGKETKERNCDTSSCSSSQLIADSSIKVKVDNEELELEEQWLHKNFLREDPDEESFEALFAKFASMKETASKLSGEERKKYAEKVAVSFWKAIGGEEDEISGLEDE